MTALGSRDRSGEGGGLSGVGVLVTRPAQQAATLVELIEARGGRAVRFPALAIVGPQDVDRLYGIIDRLTTYDLAVFVSANAVAYASEAIEHRHQRMPDRLTVAAVGPTTAAALRRSGVAVSVVPEENYDAEALLDAPELKDVAGKRIVVFRGSAGREHLIDVLRGRGASVDAAVCYQAVRPETDPGPVLECFARDAIDVVTVTSSMIAQNLFALLGEEGRAYLVATPFVTVSPRVARVCEQLGCRHAPWVADNATDAALVATLVSWRAAQLRHVKT